MAMANPRLDGAQTTLTGDVPLPPQVQRASLKKAARYARDQNGAPDFANPTRRMERHSLRRAADAEPATAKARAPMKARKPSQDSASTAYGRTSNGRQFTVGNIGNGGRIYLRYDNCQLLYPPLWSGALVYESSTREPEDFPPYDYGTHD
jgi:hypothetical protein